MTKKIIFRADGNSSIGLGHLYRLFSLVEIIKDSLEFVFVTHKTTTVSVIPIEYTTKTIPKTIDLEEEPLWLQDHFSAKDHIIIADGYQFTTSYQKKIKEAGYGLMYIDDLALEHMHADIVINHSPFLKEKDYAREAHTKLALGTKYALLRPGFFNLIKEDRNIIKIDTVFVCFGGADPFNLTEKAVKALLNIKTIETINVVLGSAYKHENIFNIAKENAHKVTLYKNLNEALLIDVMKASNIAIVPASTILYELCCVRMPILSGYYVDNQKAIYQGFLEANAIYEGGFMKDYQEVDFTVKIEEILLAEDHSVKIEAQNQLFDDQIKNRYLTIIKSLC